MIEKNEQGNALNEQDNSLQSFFSFMVDLGFIIKMGLKEKVRLVHPLV